MSIKQKINFSEFCDSFSDTYKNNFTYDGKRALFDYLEQMSEDTGEDIELDIVALCCEYTEYESMEEALTAYNQDGKKYIKDDLSDYTTVIEFDGGVIMAEF